jgi:hypothetical protein
MSIISLKDLNLFKGLIFLSMDEESRFTKLSKKDPRIGVVAAVTSSARNFIRRT